MTIGNRGILTLVFPSNPAGNTAYTPITQTIQIDGNTPQGSTIAPLGINRGDTANAGLALLSFNNIQLTSGSFVGFDYESAATNVARANLNIIAGGTAGTSLNDSFDILNVGTYGGSANATLNLGHDATKSGVTNIRGTIANNINVATINASPITFFDGSVLNGTFDNRNNNVTGQVHIIRAGHEGTGFAGAGTFLLGGTATGGLSGLVDQSATSGVAITNLISVPVIVSANNNSATNVAAVLKADPKRHFYRRGQWICAVRQRHAEQPSLGRSSDRQQHDPRSSGTS